MAGEIELKNKNMLDFCQNKNEVLDFFLVASNNSFKSNHLSCF